MTMKTKNNRINFVGGHQPKDDTPVTPPPAVKPAHNLERRGQFLGIRRCEKFVPKTNADCLIKGLALPRKGDSLMIYVFPSGNVDYKGFHEMETHRTTAVELPPHGRLIDADQLQEVLNLTLSLVITDQLTDKEIELVHRTIGAISEAINDLDTVLEAKE